MAITMPLVTSTQRNRIVCSFSLSNTCQFSNSPHSRKRQPWDKRRRRLKRRKVADGFQDFGVLAKRARRKRKNQVRLLYFAIYFHLSGVSAKVYYLALNEKRSCEFNMPVSINFLLKAVFSSKHCLEFSIYSLFWVSSTYVHSKRWRRR